MVDYQESYRMAILKHENVFIFISIAVKCVTNNYTYSQGWLVGLEKNWSKTQSLPLALFIFTVSTHTTYSRT